ncbi:MAG: hypothetical protein EAZ19_23370 [Oscillatoriales cyanobacterium]|uniref:hypothetical protein n=1 Tax=Microcoleus sp. PH2017_13_LAR_U_A TaxID=2798824 RepID=UPI001DDDC764|nr:hypothetical protein [Microcoleus sp. PH2017_13_LAR_U_A]MCC3508581.1 hypothetical protein [Microcoleus sp. PH2017_17_BER_D_A]MCC3522259.1 hypothetical protein [Microcoleus sp. PH2017_20_SFW_D_A]MCC3553208.1 hypothetical protein [Microcoleus sp. PH2017_35_SFW_U_B]TAE54999.1 MAG: hypothetical protein EAZ88_07555 [Oscillatoriales cyanobacterium]TAE69371.1 MAG: hypothetical protein EAZ86_10460 [Oscillatoriales cyanobacterium]
MSSRGASHFRKKHFFYSAVLEERALQSFAVLPTALQMQNPDVPSSIAFLGDFFLGKVNKCDRLQINQ